MGVKGLYTVLANEPSRFGRRWCLGVASNTDDKNQDENLQDTSHDDTKVNESNQRNVDIYIDGPALHHHLIATATRILSRGSGGGVEHVFKETMLPPSALTYLSTIKLTERSSSSASSLPTMHGMISPSVLYHLTTAFLSEFDRVVLGGGNNNTSPQPSNISIHLVFDGVSSIHKVMRQVDRLEESCHVADRIARRFARGGGGGGGREGTGDGADLLPHLWGEDSMVEAIQDLISSKEVDKVECGGDVVGNETHDSVVTGGTTVRYHAHSATGEAEGFIAHHLINDHTVTTTNEIIVLSNDTDFLLFDSISGFVPFHSLQFDDAGDAGSIIQGFEYRRDRFLAAFVPSVQNHHHPKPTSHHDSNSDTPTNTNNTDTNELMMTIAALAGCDYTLPQAIQRHLDASRRAIVQSELGGLKRKDRNSPTARGTLTAVVRFVAYFCSGGGGGGGGSTCHWKESMVRKIVALGQGSVGSSRRGGKGKKKKGSGKGCTVVNKSRLTPAAMLMTALDMIRDIYCAKDEVVVNDDSDSDGKTMQCGLVGKKNLHILALLLPDLRRVLLHGILFCRPIIETCDTPINEGDNVVAAKRRKGNKYTRGTSTIVGGSIWMEETFLQCRQRLYSCIMMMIEDTNSSCHPNNNNHNMNENLPLFHCRFNTADKKEGSVTGVVAVTEYCRNGTKHQVGYPGSRILFKNTSSSLSSNISFSQRQEQLPPLSSSMILQHFFFAPNYIQLECGGCEVPSSTSTEFINHFHSIIPAQYHFVSIASLLLTDRHDAVMLFLMTFVRPLLASTSISIQPCAVIEGKGRDKTTRAALTHHHHNKYLQSMGRIQIALYHAKLMRNVAILNNNGLGGEVVTSPVLSVHDIFCNDSIASAICATFVSVIGHNPGIKEETSLSEAVILGEGGLSFLNPLMDDLSRRINDICLPLVDDDGGYELLRRHNGWKDMVQVAWNLWYMYHYDVTETHTHMHT